MADAPDPREISGYLPPAETETKFSTEPSPVEGVAGPGSSEVRVSFEQLDDNQFRVTVGSSTAIIDRELARLAGRLFLFDPKEA